MCSFTLDNTPPRVAVTYPQAGQQLSLAAEPQVALRAQVEEAFVQQVEFRVDDVLVGSVSSSPFGVIWQAQPGAHTLRVVATDRAGNTAEASIDFSVGE